MHHFKLEEVIRPNILTLTPYRCARDDFDGDGSVFLDANENSLGHSIANAADNNLLALPLHRYPSPTHPELKAALAKLRAVPSIDHVFLGVGSDEIIDLLIRITCTPHSRHAEDGDSILITPPTYGMYTVCAAINAVSVIRVPLVLDQGPNQFTLDTKSILQAISTHEDPKTVKLIFLTSPGNPTGTLIPIDQIREILDCPKFTGILVVDEAYIDFAPDVQKSSALSLLNQYPNLVVMQTLSKSFGLASIRLGVAFAHPSLINLLTATKAPYNVSLPTATLALESLSFASSVIRDEKIRTLTSSRSELAAALAKISHLGIGVPQGGCHANFLLMPILNKESGLPDSKRAKSVYSALAEDKGVVVRYRGGEVGCAGCLRITIGSNEENKLVVTRLEEVLQKI